MHAVIYDPASFYGHHEFDLSIAGMFGGFNKQFYDAYHKCIPKAPGFAVRHKLYTLFHYINHWYAILLHADLVPHIIPRAYKQGRGHAPHVHGIIQIMV